MTTAPFVELGFNPTDLRPRDLPRAGAFLGSPAEALEAALAVARARMTEQMRTEVRGLASPTQAQLLRIADLAWQAAFWQFRKVSAPIMADAYLRAYLSVNAGDVPTSVLYSLADAHAEKIGAYFHDSSREALAQGFNTLVNRRVPAKAAADRVLDAYGLTPRQMRGYTSASTFETPITDALPRALKARVRQYIDKAFTGRVKKLSAQEQHNIDEQAKQYAWMWLQDKGRLPKQAQKMWITARDERVCKVCGPLHRQKVGINERFVTSQGEFWTPGLHPNCRCVVRLLENRFTVVKTLMAADLNEFNQEHPRGAGGRFSTKARTKTVDVDEEFKRIMAQPVLAPVRHISYATQAQPKEDTELDQRFAELVAAQPKRQGFAGAFDSPLEQKLALADVMTEVRDPEALLDFQADLAVELRTRTRLWEETKPKRDLTKTPTMPVGKPAYAVIQNFNLEDGKIDRIKLDHGITFHTNEIAAAQEAGELKQRIVEHMTDEMVDLHSKNRSRTVRYEDPKTGERYYADVSPKTMAGIADWYARTATAHHHQETDWNFIEDEKVELTWKPEPGENITWRLEMEGAKGEAVFPQKMSYRELGHNYFGLTPEDFEVLVVQIDRVPTSEGAVEDISGSATSAEREFSVDAAYTLVPGSQSRIQAGHFYDATIFKMEPEFSVELPEEGE